MANITPTFNATQVETEITAGQAVLHFAIVQNASVTAAYFKVWRDSAANVTPASTAADVSVLIPPESMRVVPLGRLFCTAGCSIGATGEQGIGATAATLGVTLFRD